ncbi:purine-cytosine permease family protein [Ornithinimicrobium pratense]|uniref:Allantoin permease n=1 Tax=Ornithinimicrobium pratense TaxID=2593973 RepID=A0A5J6V8S5_9MICO|nr:cytosine permease [Ornithinimicrobium pratense]QFG69566.1 allantoin permease [Ornithinimicrobium pratense]
MNESTTTRLTEGERRLVEVNGIDIIDEAERTAKPVDLFWPWFAANVSVFGISWGSFVLGFGISFWQAVLVTVVGVVLSFLFCGVIAIAGKRGSAPTMVLSRAAFGVNGQKVPGVFSWLISMGWETFLAIMAVLATATVFQQLGWASGTTTKVLAIVVIAGLIILASIAGYHTIMRLQSVLTWVTGAVTIAYIAMTWDQIDLAAIRAIEPGPVSAVIGALVMLMTGFGLGWINIAADWSRYQRRDAPGSAIVFWNTVGGALAPVLLVLYGLLLVGSRPDLEEGIVNDPIGTLATILPTWFLLPFLLAAVLALVSGAVLGIYSSGLTLLSLGVNVPRPAAAGIDGTIMTLGAVWVVFFAQSFLGPFQSFLITLGVPIAVWAGILMADIALRRRDYDERALFDSRGRYGSWNWTPITLMIVGSVVGWGLVINQFADEAAWNNWQGYLLGLGLGGRDGTWAWANLGVLAALAIGFVGWLVLGRAAVRRQEEGIVPTPAGEPDRVAP